MILYFVNNLGSYSGAAFQALNLSKSISEDIIFFNIGTEETKIKNVINLKKGLFFPFRLLFFIILHNPKFIHFHGHFLIPMAIAFLLRKPYIVKSTLLGSDDCKSLLDSKYGKLRVFLLKKSRYNFVLSEEIFKINIEYIEKHKVIKIPNGVKIGPDKIISNKKNHFYFCGVISKRKKTIEAIKFFHVNYSHLPEAKFFIIGPKENYGKNLDFEKPYVQECFDLVKQLGLNNKVIFTGLLNQKEVMSIITECKALIFFSQKEGMPNVVLEAMAHNCVPIISEMDGVGYEMTKGKCGFIIRKNTKAPTIEEIDEQINQHSPYENIKNNFTFDIISKRIKYYYDQI